MLTKEMEKRIDDFAELKKQYEMLKENYESEKELLLNELGIGTWTTDRTVLTFAETVRNTVKWKSIAEDNIEKELLEKLVAENSSETHCVMCRVNEKRC